MAFLETFLATFTAVMTATLIGQIVTWFFKKRIEPYLDLGNDKLGTIIKKSILIIKGRFPKNKSDINKISKKRIKTRNYPNRKKNLPAYNNRHKKP